MSGLSTSFNLVLASGSRVRRTLLTGAGLDPTVDPADLDEPAIEADCRLRGLDTPATALALAEAKARLVAARHPGAVVIACDQMLDVGGESLRKPDDMAGAAATLRRLAGRDHRLICGTVIRRGDETLWRHTDEAVLTMRPLDAAAIEAYLARGLSIGRPGCAVVRTHRRRLFYHPRPALAAAAGGASGTGPGGGGVALVMGPGI